MLQRVAVRCGHVMIARHDFRGAGGVSFAKQSPVLPIFFFQKNWAFPQKKPTDFRSWCSVLQCVAVCCSMLRCVEVTTGLIRTRGLLI